MGLGFIIGDGKEINIWSAPWLSTSSPVTPIGPPTLNNQSMIVKVLLDPQTNSWNLQSIVSTYHNMRTPSDSSSLVLCVFRISWFGCQRNREIILQNLVRGPLDKQPSQVKPSLLLVSPPPTGCNLSGMSKLLQSFSTSCGELSTTPFLWVSLLAIKGIQTELNCKRCGCQESNFHVIFTCTFAISVWSLVPVSQITLRTSCYSYCALDSLVPVDLKKFDDIEDKMINEADLITKAIAAGRAWDEANLRKSTTIKFSPPLVNLPLLPLPSLWIDGAWNQDSQTGGMGWIIKMKRVVTSLKAPTREVGSALRLWQKLLLFISASPQQLNKIFKTVLWSDEQTHFLLQLRIEEEQKGNMKNKVLHETARKTIADKFYDTFGVTHPWIKFRNKFNTCKKQYGAMKRLTHNRTGLGYHPNGSINMSDDWWDQRCKEWPGAKKYKDKPVPNTDLMEYIFSGVHVSGAEGWSSQQGENELDNMEVENDDAASEARPTNPPAMQTNPEPNAPSSSNGPRGSNAPRASTVPKPSRKRRAEQAAEVMRSSLQSRDEILSQKNHLIESHPDLSCSQLKAIRALHSLSSIKMWSPLYKAAMRHLKEAATNRQTFLSYEDDENKIIYLEEETGESRYA
ncbi:hypothetical protein Bca101_043958 [Brassica carinata]